MPAKIQWKRFFELNQMTQTEFNALGMGKPLEPSYAAALHLEVARQISNDGWLSMAEALKVTWAVDSAIANGVPRDGRYSKVLHDIWIGMSQSRNSLGETSPRAISSEGFGAKEHWATSHVAGPLHECVAKISYWMADEEAQYPDADPARIVLANVSAADRRLRKRAAELGIRIGVDEFEGDAA